MKRLGFLVNPIAGMGGRVALKGTDGTDILKIARERGATPLAPLRASLALKSLLPHKDDFELLTGPADMGENEAKSLGFHPCVVGKTAATQSSPEDTRDIAQRMTAMGCELLLFAGGDGTARDIYESIGDNMLSLGIPAGVKIHSAVFATSPKSAGDIALLCLFEEQRSLRTRLAEVMDIDEEKYRNGILSAKLYGYLKIPYERGRVQGLKAGSALSDEAAQASIGSDIAEKMAQNPSVLWFVGAGTTPMAILKLLGLKGTLLGVDAIVGGEVIGRDLNERQILELIKKHSNTRIVVTPIGGQGFIFGRGNQQFSPDVIRLAGIGNITILATAAKLHGLGGQPLRVDTGDSGLDTDMSGYYQIVTGYHQSAMYPVQS